MSGADAGGSHRGGRLISWDWGGKSAAAVLAALDIADVDIGSHRADAGGSCHSKRLICADGGGECAVAVLAAPVVTNVDAESHGADAGGSCHGGRLISSNGRRLMSFHLTHQSCRGGRLISSDRGGKCAAAVLAALAVANVDVGSHGADAGGSCQDRRLISSNGGGEWCLH
jgi:hypothetical protein